MAEEQPIDLDAKIDGAKSAILRFGATNYLLVIIAALLLVIAVRLDDISSLQRTANNRCDRYSPCFVSGTVDLSEYALKSIRR